MLFPFGFMQAQGPSYDADAQAFFNRVAAAGGTLTLTEKTAVNTLVVTMKADGTWTPMKAIYPMVGASAAACAQNLKSSSFTGSFTSGWTFSANGVQGNGTSAYMDTNFAPSSNLTLSSGHDSVYLRTNLAISTQVAFGVEQIANQRMVLFPYAFNIGWISDLYDNSTSRLTSSTGPSTGFVLGSRASASSHKLFRNSVQLASSTSATTGTLPTLNYYLGAFNANGSVNFYGTNQIAFYSLGDGLTDTQASNFYTAVQTFNQTLNRQVGAQVVSDADAQAYINRVYTAGGTLTNTEATAVNQLTIDMKAAGVWTAMKAVYPMVGASAAACAQNLKSSSFTGTFSSGWSFDPTGVIPNGTSAYFNTTLNVSSSLTNNSTHISYYSRTSNAGATMSEMGAGDSASNTYMQMLVYRLTGNYNGDQYFNSGSNRIDAAVANSQGFFVDSRSNSTTHKAWKSNTLIGTDTNLNTLNTSSINNTVYIGARNIGTPDLYTTRQCSFSSIGDGLTDTQASNLYTLVQAFNTTLGRQV
jgi:hypothetical protein